MNDTRKPNATDRERGRELKQLRKERGLTQAQVAECVGVSTQQYGKYERGENRLSVDRYQAILKCLQDWKSGKPAGFAEAEQAGFEPQISRSAVEKRVADALAALKDVQRYLDQN